MLQPTISQETTRWPSSMTCLNDYPSGTPHTKASPSQAADPKQPSIKSGCGSGKPCPVDLNNHLKIKKLQGGSLSSRISPKATKTTPHRWRMMCTAPQPRRGSTCCSHAASTALEFDIDSHFLLGIRFAVNLPFFFFF